MAVSNVTGTDAPNGKTVRPGVVVQVRGRTVEVEVPPALDIVGGRGPIEPLDATVGGSTVGAVPVTCRQATNKQ